MENFPQYLDQNFTLLMFPMYRIFQSLDPFFIDCIADPFVFRALERGNLPATLALFLCIIYVVVRLGGFFLVSFLQTIGSKDKSSCEALYVIYGVEAETSDLVRHLSSNSFSYRWMTGQRGYQPRN
jgi:hypothetical protein